MATVAIAAHTSTQHSLTNPNPTEFPSAIQIDATNVASPDAGNNSIKRLLGVSDEFRTALLEDSVSYVQGLSNEELFPLGEKALYEIADDLVILCEIRQRFYSGKGQILGYNNFKEFVEKNSLYSIRTVQRRLSEVNGKDQTKVNDRFKREPITIDAVEPAPAPALPVTATSDEPWSRDKEKRKNRSEPIADISQYKTLVRKMLDVGYRALVENQTMDKSHLWAAKDWAQLRLDLGDTL
jgi:hypothetical protein